MLINEWYRFHSLNVFEITGKTRLILTWFPTITPSIYTVKKSEKTSDILKNASLVLDLLVKIDFDVTRILLTFHNNYN